jgi:hypothetical protein
MAKQPTLDEMRLALDKVLPKRQRNANLKKFLSPSKVKEKLYHATPKDFKEFQGEGFDPTISGNATWLSTDPKHQPAMHNISGGRNAEFREGTNVMPVHVQAKTPLYLDDKGMIEYARAAYAKGHSEFPDLLTPETVRLLKEDGYDSIIHADPYKVGRAHEIIMLEPKRIKSAIGNRGTYDPNDPDITKAKGGNIKNASNELRLFHGTSGKPFNEFKGTTWLSDSPHVASTYANKHTVTPRVIPVHARLKNPLEVHAYEENYGNLPLNLSVHGKNGRSTLHRELELHDYDPNEDTIDSDTVASRAKKLGYDGVIFRNMEDTGAGQDAENNPYSDVYAVFDPRKIKSAITGKSKGKIPMAKGGEVKYPSIEEMLQKLREAGRTPVMPAPDRWFKHPEKHPFQQKAIEKLLAHTGHGREAFPFGAHINPITGEPLDFEIMNDLGVAIDPNTGNPMMSGIKSGLTEIDPKLGSLTKSNLIRKSLFKHEGGDPLLDRIKFLATIEKSGKGHHYGLSTQYASPAELVQEMTGNPTLRPHSRGDIYGVGDEIGRISIKGMHHPVYEKLLVAPSGSDVQGKKLHKAKGGGIPPHIKASMDQMKAELQAKVAQDKAYHHAIRKMPFDQIPSFEQWKQSQPTHAHHLEIEERPL